MPAPPALLVYWFSTLDAHWNLMGLLQNADTQVPPFPPHSDWTSLVCGLGIRFRKLPRWRGCERLWKEMRTFHSREREGPLQSKVLSCSNRPRGKGHRPTLVRKGHNFSLEFLANFPICPLLSLSSHVASGKSYFPHLWYGCMCVLSHLCLTLHDPKHCNPPGSSAHGIFQARILEWVAISFSRGSSRPRDWTPHLFRLLHWQADCLPLAPSY